MNDEHVARPLWEPISSNQLLRLLATRGENGPISRAGDNNSESRADPAEGVKLSERAAATSLSRFRSHKTFANLMESLV